MLELTLEEGYSVWAMLAVVVAAIALVAIFYRRAYGVLGGRSWRVLLALRIVAIVLVVLLLFRPVLSYYEDLVEKPPLVFLLDASASMSIADDASGRSRFDQARTQLERWCDQLKNDFRLHFIVFSERAVPVSKAAALASIAPDGKATSLSGRPAGRRRGGFQGASSPSSFSCPTESTTPPAARWKSPANWGWWSTRSASGPACATTSPTATSRSPASTVPSA